MAHNDALIIDPRQSANGALQTPSRNQDEAQNRVQEEDEGNSIRDLVIQNEDGEENQVQSDAGDRVEITAEAREQRRAEGVERGEEANSTAAEEDVDTPPVRDQQGSERSAQQQAGSQEDDASTRGFAPESASAGAQAVVAKQSDSPVNNPPGTPNTDIRGLGNTAGAQGAGTRQEKTENPIVQEARESRETISPNTPNVNVQDAIDRDREQRAAADRKGQPLLDNPTPFTPPEKASGIAKLVEVNEERVNAAVETNREEASAERNSARLDQEPQTSPSAVQTEVGQNVDRLI